MQTEAVFENISQRIQKELANSQKSIFIAVAWFTNNKLFEELIKKANEGCVVSLIISDDSINQNSSIDYQRLNINKSKCFLIGKKSIEVMHNKFCVIDYSTVITGSYNWSYKAEINFENIIITNDDTILAKQFITEFEKIRNLYYPNYDKGEAIFPLTKIIRRLEIVQNYILLEDFQDLDKEVRKLKCHDFNSNIKEILDDISKGEFAQAVINIRKFIESNHQLVIWTDLELTTLNLEIKNLENQLNSYDNEKIELEKLLSEFQHVHTVKLSKIILEILKFRKVKYKNNKSKYEEAVNDEKKYRAQVNAEKKIEINELTVDQKSEIKQKFRKATVLCHPDKVPDEFEDAAKEIFVRLVKAYETNNLDTVSDILENLEKGGYLKLRLDTISDKEQLKSAKLKLRKRIKAVKSEIISIKQSKIYKTVEEIDNWKLYFVEMKGKLEQELEKIKSEIELM